MAEAIKNKKELVITRVFDAPRERVWRNWTDPEEVKKWWGPKDFIAPHISMDFRVGGKYVYCMRGAAGPDAPIKDYWSTGKFTEIMPMEKIMLIDSFADEKGNIVPATYYGMSKDFPLEMPIMIVFEEYNGGKTKLTLKYFDVSGINATDLSNMEQGWNQSLDKFAEALKD